MRRFQLYFSGLSAPLAQLAEQLTLNQRVLGSSPRGSTLHYQREKPSLTGTDGSFTHW